MKVKPVPRRSRRVLLLLLPVLLLLGGLSACGGGDDSEKTGLDAVTIEGDPGSEPTVTWDGQMEVDKLTTKVLQPGDGETVGDGDKVLTHIWIGNGYTQEKSFSTYDEKKPELVTVDQNLSKVFLDAIEGQKIGARVAVAAPADEAFGEQGNPQLKIGNKDTVLVVVDLVSGVLDGPDGDPRTPAAWAPKIVEKDKVPTGLDFTKTPKPTDRLRATTVLKGSGPAIEKGQTAVVNYLGQVYGGKKPFDESYSKGAPVAFPIGVGQVVKGWDQGLVGVKVGSRVMLAVPPKLGYGPQGNKQAGIKGTDTLYFVVDVLAAG